MCNQNLSEKKLPHNFREGRLLCGSWHLSKFSNRFLAPFLKRSWLTNLPFYYINQKYWVQNACCKGIFTKIVIITLPISSIKGLFLNYVKDYVLGLVSTWLNINNRYTGPNWNTPPFRVRKGVYFNLVQCRYMICSFNINFVPKITLNFLL